VSAAGDRAAIAHDDTVEVYELPNSRLLRVIRRGAAANARDSRERPAHIPADRPA